MILPKPPTLVTVYVPPSISSGLSLFSLARCAKSFTRFAIPIRLSWSACLITGTIRFPSFKAVAIPRFISLCLIIDSPSTETFNIGCLAKAEATASIKIGVNVIFSAYFF